MLRNRGVCYVIVMKENPILHFFLVLQFNTNGWFSSTTDRFCRTPIFVVHTQWIIVVKMCSEERTTTIPNNRHFQRLMLKYVPSSSTPNFFLIWNLMQYFHVKLVFFNCSSLWILLTSEKYKFTMDVFVCCHFTLHIRVKSMLTSFVISIKCCDLWTKTFRNI